MPYKEDGYAPFKAISRQVLFAEPQLGCELRYFEMAPGGYSTLERHGHMHAVMILRGHGHCLVGEEVREVKPFDLITIPGLDLASVPRHQRGSIRLPLHGERSFATSRSSPPSKNLETLKSHPAVAAFLTGP